jgi:hypothetical protein
VSQCIDYLTHKMTSVLEDQELACLAHAPATCLPHAQGKHENGRHVHAKQAIGLT